MTETVYHYTDSSGIKGIVETNSIWLSHADFLNDKQEARIGRSLGFEMLNEVSSGTAHDAPELVRKIAKVATDRLLQSERFPTNPDAHIQNGLFIASFSTHCDDLAQYRGYSTTNSRYCIGFSRSKLEELAAASELEFRQVTYDAEVFKDQLYAKFVANCHAMIDSHIQRNYHPDDPYHWHFPDIPDMVEDLLKQNALLAKHRAFRAEGEWRLHTRPKTLGSYVGTQSLYFRSAARGLVPYISQSLQGVQEPIVSVLVGPSEDPVGALHAIKLLVQRRRSQEARAGVGQNRLFVSELAVECSDIPFRG